MTLSTLLKLALSAKLPITAGLFGLVLNFGGSNIALKNSGAALTYLAMGAGVVSVGKKNSALSEIQQLTARHEREKTLLKQSADTALADTAIAQRTAQQQAARAQQADTIINQLRGQMRAAQGECDRIAAEVVAAQAVADGYSSQLATCGNDNSLLAGQIEVLEVERMQLIYELYETAVTEADIAASIAGLEAQFKNDSAYQLTQKKKAKSALTKARANFHTEITEAQERINELETQLEETRTAADGMLTEINGTAHGQLSHFDGKAKAQAELIKSLQAQLDESRKSIKALTYRRFDTVGTDNVMGNRLIDALAKHGSTYGAFHHEREGNNGRLKVWLSLIDAPLRRAQEALEDIEAELSLWAKPSVKVDRGMHLFTLATEQEHKVLAAPQVPLSRLEKTLDSAIHARIVGGSGSGKTVLLNNLMHYMAASMKGANMTLLDPKAVDDWGRFIPKYWGEECVEGIVALADGLKWRVSDTVKARKAGKPAPDYDPELFVLDEAQYNYLLAQNADASYVKERGETAPNYAKKAKGALAGLLSLGRAYNAIGLFVTQLPQVSKVGLNEGSFDPCVNVFLGKQIDNAISSFLPGSGYSDAKCKALDKELNTRRKLGQQWIMLVADLPRSEAYLMECPAPGYYHNRFSGVLDDSTETGVSGETSESVDTAVVERGEEKETGEVTPVPHQRPTEPAPASKNPSAHCPKCSHKSVKLHTLKPFSNGKYRFSCENDECQSKTFRALPLT